MPPDYLKIPPDELTPVMLQYQQVKAEHSDALLFYRMGDFYELFFNDAEVAAKELNIILTKKQIKNNNIPMCGVPHHSYENYLDRLIKAGHKVAICEQLEKPEEAKQRAGSKAVIKREVVRVVTPGTVTEESLLPTGSFNYLACIFQGKKNAAIAWIDISTGDFYVENCKPDEILNVIHRIMPKEIIISSDVSKQIFNGLNSFITDIPGVKFNFISNHKLLQQFFSNQAFSNLPEEVVIVCGVLLDYLNLTQKASLPPISFPKLCGDNKSVMRMDFFTRSSLELTSKLNGESIGSLKSVINYTLTKGGNRLLDVWINSPLTNMEEINARLEVVEFFVKNKEILENIRLILKNSPDIIRTLSRLSMKRGTPLDLAALKVGLEILSNLREKLIGKKIPELLQMSLSNPINHSVLLDKLTKALKNPIDLPNTTKEGGFIKAGFSTVLDSLKATRDDIVRVMTKLQEQYIVKTQITNLKIQYNNMIGYYIEVPSKNAATMLSNPLFIHKQTLLNAARFSTEELLEQERSVTGIEGKIIALEEKIFNDILDLVLEQREQILTTGFAVNQIDVLSSFAYLAQHFDLTKPIVDESCAFEVKEGRHLVVENGLKKYFESNFTPNNCLMSENSNLFLITGPNMAGKSTFLRQNALIIIMAQMGCYVPAKFAHIGIVDAIFSRVGSADNLYKGQSTFMVEMLELATILNNATEKSFVILDEIGRGTATYDGLAIAFACLKYLHDTNKSRTLFATHYHELTKLQESLKRIVLYNVEVSTFKGELIFMHKVVEGAANKSYGVHVAKLAGIPKEVLKNAEDLLTKLETGGNSVMFDIATTVEFKKAKNKTDHELPLFNASVQPVYIQHPIITELLNLEVDELSPKDALSILYNMQNDLKNTKESKG